MEEKVFIRSADSDDFDKLADFLDEHNFSCQDLLAILCAHLGKYKDKLFETELLVGGEKFKIRIEK